MIFPNRKIRLKIQGNMPERALLRLRRAKIPLYEVKKAEKNAILLCVKRKDVEKVFAIYPNVCYNIGGYTAYTVTKVRAVGPEKALQTLKKRWGVLLGIPLFCLTSLYADNFTFGVRIVGSQVYEREVHAALDEVGIRPFTRYKSGREDEVCAKLLALDNVEFCSVQKSGLWVRVEVQLGSFPKRQFQKGKMRSSFTGEIVAITALRGTPLKKVGDKITEGEILVEDSFFTEGGGQVRVEIIARVQIACVYEALVCADDAESAFAKAYLLIGADGVKIQEKNIEPCENNAYKVRLVYVAVQTMNL